MKKKIMSLLSMILVSAILLMGCAVAEQEAQSNVTTSEDLTVAGDINNVNSSEVVVDTEFTANDLEVGYDQSTATKIVLSGDRIAVSGEGATSQNNVLTITKEGTYVLEGILSNGQIIVDAGDNDKIQLVLNGAEITCLSNAPIYIKNADKVFVTLAEGTDNSLADGADYVQTDENEVDGVIYSKADLTLNGSGALTVTGNYKHGIVSKDELVITGGNYTVTAEKDAINGKDCVKIKDGVFTLSSATGDGIQSKNSDDSTKGYVYISGGTLEILQSDEGIEGTAIIIEDGVITVNSTDDGFNAASGSSEVTSDSNSVTPDTEVEAVSSATGDPGPGGMKRSTAPSGQAPDGDFPQAGRGKGDFGGGNAFEVDENCYIRISGGTITVNAQGDGLDSNGSLYISGGNVYVNGPTENMNGSLDYTGSGEITGGIVIATGSAGMAQSFGETSTQCSILYHLTSAAMANTLITLTDENGKEIVRYTANKQYQSVVISSPELVQGETYTLTCGDQTEQITLTAITFSNGLSSGLEPKGMNR